MFITSILLTSIIYFFNVLRLEDQAVTMNDDLILKNYILVYICFLKPDKIIFNYLVLEVLL